MGNYTHTQLKSKSFEEIQKLYKKEQQWINDFVPMSDDSGKKGGKKDDSSSKQAESSKHDEESVKKHKLEDEAEREELRACLDIVKERYETTSPEGYDLLLWGDLKNLLEPSEEDEI
ncbi:hypothetical protein Tco_0054579 [Tanacetum coccineum]